MNIKKPKLRWKGLLGALGRAHHSAQRELDASLPLLQHLNELRRRLFKAFLAVAAATGVSAVFGDRVIDYLARPIGGSEALVSIEITENVAIFMRVCLLSGLVLGMPVVAYQILRFVMPGLNKNEKSWIYLGVPFASLLFAGGAAFAWFVMIPTAVPFLTQFLDITTQVRPENYFEFTTKLMLWIGLSFEMPLVAFVLAKTGLMTAGQLAAGWRFAVVGIAVLAATITPTVDPVNMGLVMLPLFGLYLLSIGLAWAAKRG
jgi:sec-independent protein translocase protein TatC